MTYALGLTLSLEPGDAPDDGRVKADDLEAALLAAIQAIRLDVDGRVWTVVPDVEIDTPDQRGRHRPPHRPGPPVSLLDRLRRREPQRDLEPDLRPRRWWRVDVRIAHAELTAWERGHPVSRVAEISRTLNVARRLVQVDWSPPASGPEAEVKVWVCASTGEIAERTVTRVLERLAMSPLAIRSTTADVLELRRVREQGRL